MSLYVDSDATLPGAPAPKRAGGFNAGVHGLRGIAAAMVLFAHVLGGTAEHIYADNAGYVAAVDPLWNLGTYFVYLFFAISGFVILPSAFRYGTAEFALRRVVRIYPLFLACTLLFVAGNAVTNAEPSLNHPATILFGLTFTNLLAGTEQLTPNAWSLSYEVMFYVLAALAAVAFHRRNPVVGFVIGAASVAFLVSFPASIYFLVGTAVYKSYQRGLVRPIPQRRLIEAILAGALFYTASRGHFAYNPQEIFEPVAQLTIVTTAAYFLFAVERDSLTSRILSARPTQYLGTVSYSLYLVHPYVYLALRVAFNRLGLFGDNVLLSVGVFGAVVFATAIATAHISFLLFEKLPQTLVFHRRRSLVTMLEAPRPMPVPNMPGKDPRP